MKKLIKKVRPLYYLFNKIKNFKLETIYANFYYLYCLLVRKAYFGKKYGASMLDKNEAKVLRKLLLIPLSVNGGGGNFLEIGSWAGASAVVLGKTLKDLNLKSKLICVDVWRGTGDGIIITKSKISGKTIFNLFKRNIKLSGVADYVIPVQITSDEFFLNCKTKFSFIYIDGDHRYTQAMKDINNAFNGLEIGGILCGDDLDGFVSDEQLFRANAEKDIAEIRGNIYHCGVSCAIKDVFNNNVGINHSIWSIQKTKDGWIPVN